MMKYARQKTWGMIAIVLLMVVSISLGASAQERTRIQAPTRVQASPDAAIERRGEPRSGRGVSQDAFELTKVAAMHPVPPEGLSTAEEDAISRVVRSLRAKDLSEAEPVWNRSAASIGRRGGRAAIDAAIGHILYKAYIDTNEDLKYRAEKVRFYNAQLEAARGQRALLERHRDTLRRAGNSGETVRVKALRLAPSFRPGAPPVLSGAAEDKNVDSVIDDLAGIVVLCDHAEQDAQFANIELQNALQKQQETYTNMSMASKMLRGGAMPSIRNVR